MVALALTLALCLLFFDFTAFNAVSASAGVRSTVVGGVTILLLVELPTEPVLALTG